MPNWNACATWPRMQDLPSTAIWERASQQFCGGPVVDLRPDSYALDGEGVPMKERKWAHTYNLPNSPLWMIKSYDTAIIDNHSEISKFPFEMFVKQIYHNIGVRHFDEVAFGKLGTGATKNFSDECGPLMDDHAWQMDVPADAIDARRAVPAH